MWLLGSVACLFRLTQSEMPPSSPASSEGSTGMVPYSLTRIRGSVSRRDRRMMNISIYEGGATC